MNLPSIKNPSATPPNGTPAYSNGKTGPLSPSAKGSGQSQSQAPLRPTTKPGQGDIGESATQLEAQPFEDEANTTAEPVAAAARKLAPANAPAKTDRSGGMAAPSARSPYDYSGRAGGNDKATASVGAFDDTLDAGMGANRAQAAFDSMPRAPTPAANDDDDLDMDIGEVSRVVKLADLVKPNPNPKPAQRRSGQMAAVGGSTPNPMLGRTGSVPRLSQPMMPLGADASRMSGPQLMADGVPPMVAEPLAPAVVASHRRGIIALLIGAAVLIGTAIVIVVLVVNKETPDVTSLGGEYDLNTQRPDQIVRRPGDPPEQPINPYLPPPVKQPPKYVKPPVKDTPPVQPPAGNSLKAEEIETMAAKYGGTTQSCYRRAQRGANGILLADVKKVTVTLSIAPDGLVANVALSDNMAANDLGKCLVNAMRSWKFRANAGGDFRFVLHFG
jgi:hypothetical protein